jgi:Tfp pilus assembly protein PilN
MRAVNLLPRQATTDEKLGLDRAVVVGVAITVLVAVMLAGGFFLEKAHAATQRQRLAAAQSALAQAQSQQPSNASPRAQLQIPVVLSQQEPWHVALHAALAARVSWDVLLRQLEYVVPDRVRLTAVTVGGSGASAGAASGTITLGGYVFSSDDLAVFLSTLARVPNVSQVTLVSTTTTSGSTIQTFQITAQMTLPAALTAPPATDTTSTTTGAGG